MTKMKLKTNLKNNRNYYCTMWTRR